MFGAGQIYHKEEQSRYAYSQKKSSKVKMKNPITFPHTFSHLEAQEISTSELAQCLHMRFL